MKIVSGEGKKKSEILGGPAEGGPGFTTTDLGNFKDVRFYSILNFGHFWAPSLVTLLTFKNVNNPQHLNTISPQHLNHKP